MINTCGLVFINSFNADMIHHINIKPKRIICVTTFRWHYYFIVQHSSNHGAWGRKEFKPSTFENHSVMFSCYDYSLLSDTFMQDLIITTAFKVSNECGCDRAPVTTFPRRYNVCEKNQFAYYMLVLIWPRSFNVRLDKNIWYIFSVECCYV